MRLLTAVTAVVCWIALVVQLYLIVVNAPANGVTAAIALNNYFSFFTILTNILVALSLTLPLLSPQSNIGGLFALPSVQTGVAVYIAMVGIVYSLLLRRLWNPEGLQKSVDAMLHDIVPVLFVTRWLLYVRKNSLRWRDALIWLGYPLAYILYIVVRGELNGRYPYPFIDVTAIGYGRALINAAGLLCAFLAMGLILIGISRALDRRR